jgi:hypothetical protein
MGKFAQGTKRTYSRVRYGLMRVDPLTLGVSKIGKQSKFGPRKGTTPPGNKSHKINF